jgi:hypothetical protein
MTRKEANIKLLEILTETINKHEDIRFSQALVNLDMVKYLGDSTWVNDYYLEPRDLLKRVEEKIQIAKDYLEPK